MITKEKISFETNCVVCGEPIAEVIKEYITDYIAYWYVRCDACRIKRLINSYPNISLETSEALSFKETERVLEKVMNENLINRSQIIEAFQIVDDIISRSGLLCDSQDFD